jgi:starch synthase (maltosyl-transferring)
MGTKQHTAGLALPLRRPAIDSVSPCIDRGRFPIKRTVGETVDVTAALHADGHDLLSAAVLFKPASATAWRESPMMDQGNDLWRGEFAIESLEPYRYTVQAWINSYLTWQTDLSKRWQAGQDLAVELQIGAQILREASGRAAGDDATRLQNVSAELAEAVTNQRKAVELACSAEIVALAGKYADRSRSTTFDQELGVEVDRERARFSSWYEMFPRSCADDPSRHGTFRDCIGKLEYVAKMGFDVLYFPPIHPIGRIERKGRNNTLHPSADDVGSPWAIGAREGGHKSLHPQLGTLHDFRELLAKAAEHGLEIALDIAFQCAPDHPYVKDHKDWFRIRPDGSVQYAENPPKQYQDIYPLNFESAAAGELCEELKSVVLYWIGQGVRIFRVDNPHTKPYPFWEWLIQEIRRQHPDVIFLAEAFTRPKVMYRLAKLGFTQSYTYFTWRTTKKDLVEYFTELTQGEPREFFRPNLWPNTPDILPEHLQAGGRPAFLSRLILAATLGANYGIYGPAFELCENRAIHQGSEEYLDSEKYQIRAWDTGRADSLRDVITRLNRERKRNPALQRHRGLRFHPVDNDQLIAFTKSTADRSENVLVVVNLDPQRVQAGWLELPLHEFNLADGQSYPVHDVLSGADFLWNGPRNYVELDPRTMPGHVFRLGRSAPAEREFDSFA